MDQLITDALSYSHAVRTDLQLAPIDPARLLRGMIESYPVFQEPNAHIRIDSNLPAVLANEAGLTQCFSNLLGNAVKFVAPGTVPEVKIRAEGNEGCVRLWFEDNGIGIPEAMKDRVFDMFQRASKEYEGTGIGLALVRKVSERMGGNVGVESEPGRGSRFWLELKRAAPGVAVNGNNGR
jgi:signal transduction histidine kinase